MLSHFISQLESIDGPEKVRRHLSIRGGAHVTLVSYSPGTVYSHLTSYKAVLAGIWTRTSRMSGYLTAFDTVINLDSRLFSTYSLDALAGSPLCLLHHM